MKDNKKKTVVSIVAVLVLILLVVGVTYAAFTFSNIGTTENSVTTGSITMTYTEADNGITLTNAMPTTDEAGKVLSLESQVFDFTADVSVVGNTTVSYEVTAVKDNASTLANNEVKLYLEKGVSTVSYEEVMAPTYYVPIDAADEFGAQKGEMVLDTDSITTSTINYYRLRMWVDKEYVLSGTQKTFTVKVNVYGKGGVTQPTLAEKVKVGDYISMTPDATSYTISASDTGYTSDQTINPSELNTWRVLSASSSGIEVISENVSSKKVFFKGMIGYQNYIGTLNKIAAQYTNSKYVTATKHFGYNGQTENITDTSKITENPQTWKVSTKDNSNEMLGGGDVMYTAETDLVKNALGILVAKNPSGTVTEYWLASHFYNYYSGAYWSFSIRSIDVSEVLHNNRLYYFDSSMFADSSYSGAIRPRLTLESSITSVSGSGTSEEPYVLS